jgi:hypothetical protein
VVEAVDDCDARKEGIEPEFATAVTINDKIVARYFFC